MIKLKNCAAVTAISALLIAGLAAASSSAADVKLSDPVSPGLSVIAYENPMVLSGEDGRSVSFGAENFSARLGYVPSSITVLSLPSAECGVLRHDNSPVEIGQSVSVLTFSSLSFERSGTDDAEFTFTPDGVTVLRCVMRCRDAGNLAPGSALSANAKVWTGEDTPVMGHLAGADPDGDGVKFEIVSYPSRGLASITDAATGEFVYSPYAGTHGKDSFTYRIADAFGAYSPEYTVDVAVESGNFTVCSDMDERYSAYAASKMVAAGVMQVKNEANAELFEPDAQVSRIDFLQMAMDIAGASDVPAADYTSFSDDAELSDVQKGYLSAAYRLGIVNGSIVDGELVFSPNEPITGGAAAVILNKILGLPENDAVSVMLDAGSVPAWSRASLSALTAAGVIDRYTAPANDALTRENAATILTRLSKMLEN